MNVLTFAFFIIPCSLSYASELPRPRGVPPSRAPLYSPDKDFQCLDGSKTIPYLQINDDYCDCLDGSDEPGTSACLNGLFHCQNSGHRPLDISSGRVNDGICDCCDGSDEYTSPNLCSDRCLELGKAAREEAKRKAELIEAGKQLRADMAAHGKKTKQENIERLEELKKSHESAVALKEEKLKLKKEAEEDENRALEYYRKIEEEVQEKKRQEEREKETKEALDVFDKFDSNSDGILELSEIQTRNVFDQDKNGEISEEEAKYYLGDQNRVDRASFYEKSWAQIKPLLMRDAGLFKPPSEEEKLDENDNENEETQDEDEDNEDLDEDIDEHQDDTNQEETDQKSDSSLPYDDETQEIVNKATEARNLYTDAESQVRNIENDVKHIQNYLELDFGPDEEFAPLKGQCFELSDHEYIYKLCPFDSTIQTPLSGSSETRLGSWGKWSDDQYTEMTYERGQSCWNGPQRSTVVKISCGGDNRLISVSEPNRCEYLFEFETPAACRELSEDNGDVHDEL